MKIIRGEQNRLYCSVAQIAALLYRCTAVIHVKDNKALKEAVSSSNPKLTR